MPELKQDQYQPKQGEAIEKWVIVSKNAHKVEAEIAPNVNVANVAQASIDVEVNFEGSRGAVLAMYRPRTMELPKDILLERLSKIPLLRDKGSTSTKLKFIGQLPVPHAPGVTVGGELRVGWKSENVSSSYQEAHNIIDEDDDEDDE
ncbi:hypothetical protein EIP86_005907 [Pleurotus ostreatoroseus]|nr:hypothetical protein EIP86_005907 [Pleurotus ostreatoroseus]